MFPCFALISSVSHYEDGRRGSTEGSADRDSLRSCTYCCRPASRVWAQPPVVMVTLYPWSAQSPSARPVWPGMQNSYQAVSTRVHPQWAGHCPSVEKHTGSLLVQNKKIHIPTPFFFSEQNERLLRVDSDLKKGPVCMISNLTCSFPLCSYSRLGIMCVHYKKWFWMLTSGWIHASGVFSIIFILTLSVTSTSNHNYRLSTSIWLTQSTLLAAFSKNLARQGTKKRGTLSRRKYWKLLLHVFKLLTHQCDSV